MIQFSTMGELQYIERYKIDKSTKLIAEFVAGIKNIKDKYFNVIITAQRYIENKEEYYETSVQFTDINGKYTKMEFRSRYIMRLDHYMDHIDRLYKSKVEKEAPNLDYSSRTWYNSTIKTENEYQVYLGSIKTNNPKDTSENVQLYITVDKQLGATKYGNDTTIKSITVEDETVKFNNTSPVEIYTVSENGLVTFSGQNVIHAYYDEFGIYDYIKYSELYIPENNILSNIHPCCMLHNKMTITYMDGHSESFNIDYDEFGIYSKNSFINPDYRLPVVYERYVNDDNEFLEVNSIHPIHIDHSNLQVNHHQFLYAMDRFIFQDDYSHEYDKYAEFTREVRKLTDDNMNHIKDSLDEYTSDDPPMIYVENFESIIEEALHNRI